MAAKYYNKTRGPLNIPLRDGSTLYILPKKWSEVVPDKLDGSEALRRSEKSGDLLRRLVTK